MKFLPVKLSFIFNSRNQIIAQIILSKVGVNTSVVTLILLKYETSQQIKTFCTFSLHYNSSPLFHIWIITISINYKWLRLFNRYLTFKKLPTKKSKFVKWTIWNRSTNKNVLYITLPYYWYNSSPLLHIWIISISNDKP